MLLSNCMHAPQITNRLHLLDDKTIFEFIWSPTFQSVRPPDHPSILPSMTLCHHVSSAIDYSLSLVLHMREDVIRQIERCATGGAGNSCDTGTIGFSLFFSWPGYAPLWVSKKSTRAPRRFDYDQPTRVTHSGPVPYVARKIWFISESLRTAVQNIKKHQQCIESQFSFAMLSAERLKRTIFARDSYLKMRLRVLTDYSD